MAGTYNVLDAPELLQGRRNLVWHGLWFKKESLDRLDEYFSRAPEILVHTRQLLDVFRVFLLPLPVNRRLMARVEAAIMNTIYAAQPEIAAIPDRGMSLAPRRLDEKPISVILSSDVVFHGLPSTLMV